jgi:cytosine permease
MASTLPTYVTAAKPVPQGDRAPWYKNTAQTYAGIMLWFAFWQSIPAGDGSPGGVLGAGIGPALIGIVLAGLVCHFLFYLVPALLGMQTGLPLYVVGTSTYGVRGGLFMPGFLMGLLQFGWLAFNAYFVSEMLCRALGIGLAVDGKQVAVPGAIHGSIAAVWAVLAAFVGLKGIQYVARVASYLPAICLIFLLVMFFATMGGLGDFTPQKLIDATAAAKEAEEQEAAEAEAAGEGAAEEGAEEEAAAPTEPLNGTGVIVLLVAAIAGFFATAGAAGTDIASNNRDANDVQMGGLTGIALATIVSCGLAVLVIAGAYGQGLISGSMNPVELIEDVLGERAVLPITVLLAVSSFPPACFSSFIAANSFKTTLPQVNPFISVGIGTAVAIALAATGVVAQVVQFFGFIGATFGPVCGAMAADYLLAGKKWAGPRAGFNLAGWISWVVGACVGLADVLGDVLLKLLTNMYPEGPPEVLTQACDLARQLPCPPVAALFTGFVLYLVLAKIGLESKALEMPQSGKEPATQ